MYNTDAREQFIQSVSPLISFTNRPQDSILLRLYSTLIAMYETQIAQPAYAYQKVLEKYNTYQYAFLQFKAMPPADLIKGVVTKISCFSFLDILTHVVPGLVCDPKKTLELFQKYQPELGHAEQTHHILQIRLLAAKRSSPAANTATRKGVPSYIDALYGEYLLAEQNHVLDKELFSNLYSSITTFELSPGVLSPKAKGSGFTRKQLEDLMGILTDGLQMSRSQQLDMLAQYFIKKDQARQIINNQKLYNFTACKNEKERIALVNKALRLIAKIPPLELICAISTRKKIGTTNTKRKTEATVVPNDVMLETGFIFPALRNLIGLDKNTTIVLIYPSAHFVRQIWCDQSLKDRNITIVMQDEATAALLQYQANDNTYAVHFDSSHIIGPTAFVNQLTNESLIYEKIVLFGSNLPMDQQHDVVCRILDSTEPSSDMYALLSSYVIDDKSSMHGEAFARFSQYMQTISLIPQGINNSSFPRRKMWIHFTKNSATLENAVTKVYAYTLDTSLQTQALSFLQEAPLEILRSDFAGMESSIRKRYSQEILMRGSSGRTRSLPFVHEITPDIPVWCSRSFPNGTDKNPRLEAYVCLPDSKDRLSSSFSERGEILQQTKKHTTSISQSNVLSWLENEYPFSVVQQRYTRKELELLDTGQPLKPVISIREEIIEKFTPLLEKENISLKTLWYLYPNLQNYYTGSDYLVLSQMMHTIIGQQRVCDITAEMCEKLLIELYPEYSEAALWRNYTILSIAMEKAKAHGFCSSNPLADALHQEKRRKELFAQVRKQLVKKHLTKPQLKQVYSSVISKLQNGQYAYLGVLIRLLTGLESSIICALQWSDMVRSPHVDVVSFVLTKQVSNDGHKFAGFSDAEDYICFPLPTELRNRLTEYHQELYHVSDDDQILNSVMRLGAEETQKEITPAVLNGLTKEILHEVNIEEDPLDLACGNNEFRKTNLNKYMGDFIRENFRYWAMKAAKLHPDELSILLRNRVATTFGRYYGDFQTEISLAILAAKLSRVECLFMQNEPPMAYHRRQAQTFQYTARIYSKHGYRQEVSLEIAGTKNVNVSAYSTWGVYADITPIIDEDGEIK